ncbi:MAG TPA: hypothetical protein VL171_07955 [Verrucomicrobiae bacterium]|nr:hypothetical protein [Verrucomicrobiae bacterium]
MKSCGKKYGQGLGGVRRRCLREEGHTGRCTDMPFLLHLEQARPKVADKIVRDSFNTRGASWGKAQDGTQKRRNRQPRWTLKAGDAFYPAHHQTYDECLVVAAELTVQAYEMVGAPECPAEIAQWLPRKPVQNSAPCPICKLPLEFSEFDLAVQSKAAIDTDHLNPTLKRRHVRGNVAFVHHLCNTTKGDRSLEEFETWMAGTLSRQGYNVSKKA